MLWEDVAIGACLVAALVLNAIQGWVWYQNRLERREASAARWAQIDAYRTALRTLQIRSAARALEGASNSFLLGHDDALEALAEVAHNYGLPITFTNKPEGWDAR